MKIKYIKPCYKYKVEDITINFIILYITFKINNIFITITKYIKYFEFFTFCNVLKSLSCGTQQFKNSKKLSLYSYIQLSLEFMIFLIKNNYTKIYILLKNNKKYEKYSFLKILLISVYENDFLKIPYICHHISIPNNGCKLKKRKFL